MSTALKDLATELHVFMSTATQLSGDFKNGRGVRDQTFIRSSKAVADKADVGCIIVRISDEEKATISPLIEALGLPMPTHVIDVYKNRRSRYNQVKIWSVIDLGTCRENDILITTGDYEEIKDFKEIKFKKNYFSSLKKEDKGTENDMVNTSEEKNKIKELANEIKNEEEISSTEDCPFDGPYVGETISVPTPKKVIQKKGSRFSGLL